MICLSRPAGKLAWAVLRGGSGSNAAVLPGVVSDDSAKHLAVANRRSGIGRIETSGRILVKPLMGSPCIEVRYIVR